MPLRVNMSVCAVVVGKEAVSRQLCVLDAGISLVVLLFPGLSVLAMPQRTELSPVRFSNDDSIDAPASGLSRSEQKIGGNMNTYLVTGGAGFIGSHLTESLLAEGNKVIVLDNMSTGTISNIESFRDNPNLELVIDSIMNVDVVSELVGRSDYIFHMAAVVGVRLVLESPIRTIQSIVHGTDIVLELASKKNKTVFLASTSEVYGKSTALPFSEEGDVVLGATCKGRWSYACAKAIDEFLALAYYRECKLRIVVGRHFNTVGPRQTARYGMVLPQFIAQAVAGKPVTVYGDGRQQRCFCHVNDVVWSIKRLIHNPRSYGKVFNVGSREEISILDLARLVKARTHSDSEIVFVPYEDAYDNNFEDMPRRIPDLHRLHEMVGAKALVPLAQIIDQMAEHHLSHA
jgi:UDP-glucose 4-epimerase